LHRLARNRPFESAKFKRCSRSGSKHKFGG
jgi:hypothetical protein